MDKGKRFSQRNTRNFYLLRCRVRCTCGYAMVGSTKRDKYGVYRYYHCHSVAKERVRPPCGAPHFNADHVEAVVWLWLEEEVLTEENLRKGIERRQLALAGERQRLDEQRVHYYEQRAELERQITRLAQLYTAGIFTLEEVAEEKQRLDGVRDALTGEIEGLDRCIAGLGLSAEDAEELVEIARQVRQKLLEGITDTSKQRVLHLLDVSVILLVEDGAKYADVTARMTLQSQRLIVLPAPG